MEEGYAMIAIGKQLDGWLQFSQHLLADGGYVRAEADLKKP